ncbi:hypothetical protein GCM10023215_31270 [Pseudonocardia yuanmonensis]|uniref:Uncharacterized protein n=1 Tax=Pseudonocardia yuanmonensis TaxID=1095914 RepID=A0ABP8WLS7_9PSEU
MATTLDDLRDLFALDLTGAVLTCGGCGERTELHAHDLYPDAPALVVRCPSCTAVVLRFGTGGGRIRLDLSGTRLLTVTAPDPAGS